MSETATRRFPASRTAGAVIVGLALVAIVTTVVLVRPAAGPGPEFVTRDGDHLMLEGEPFSYASTNTYELMFQQPPTIDNYLDRMVEQNLSVLRTWAFFDIGNEDGSNGVEIANKGTYFQYFDPEQGRPVYNDGPTGLEHLDYVVYAAKERGIKLILPFVNNWANFGGVDQYVRWRGGLWHDDFINDDTIKGWYKDWVNHLLNRTNIYTGVKYKDEPAIMAWELVNEFRCSESGPYASSAGCISPNIVDWVDEMSTYVKSIDRNHLVAFGSEGFLCTHPGGGDWLTACSETGDPEAITNLPNIDMNGIHIYPDHWNPEEPTDDGAAWSVWWIEQHAAIAERAGKPFYIGEYGWRDKETRLPVFNEWLDTFYSHGGDGSNFWIMQPYNSFQQIPDYDGFTVYCPSPVCELVTNWNLHVRDGVDWNEFGPIADGDFFTTALNTPVSFSIVDNDIAFGDATLDLGSIDLDPATPGIQHEVAVERGTYTVDGGVVTFVPTTDEQGSARISYVIADSEGRQAAEITISVVIQSPTE